MSWLLVVKVVIILFFLVMFLRKPSVTWGVGLLTVTTAMLLDALLGTFDEEALRADLGFFYYVFAGTLFGGSAVWLWGVLAPYVTRPLRRPQHDVPDVLSANRPQEETGTVELASVEGVDNQMLYQEIHQRFGPQDIYDLMFDLNINENDVTFVGESMDQLTRHIMDYAIQNGQTSTLALAVERILTPLPADHLPRLEKIKPDSPPTIIRQYLLANYDLASLLEMSEALDVDWEALDAGGKKVKVRSLLQYLYRRNRVGDLVHLMYVQGGVGDEEE
jgi:hypothetical protein